MNKELDEHKMIVVEMNKRMFHIIIGLLTEQGISNLVGNMKILSERNIE